MKYLLLALSAIPGVAFAGTCADITLKKGAVLSYESESAPQHIKDLAYFKSSKKEQAKADAEFDLKVSKGELKGASSTFTTTVDDVIDTPDSRQFVLNTVKWGVSNVTRVVCANGVVSIAPAMDVQETTSTTPQGTVTTTTMNGYNKIPLVLKEGDPVPDYQNVSVSSPMAFEIPLTVVHTTVDANGDVWQSKTTSTTNFDVTSTTVAKYANREVIGFEDLALDGATVHAAEIHTEVFSKSSMKTSSADFLTDTLAKIQRKAIERKVYKAAGSADGFTAAVINEWFAPDLGLIAKMEVYDPDGRLLAKQRLAKVQNP